jgi:RNA polymerase sigma-70 factor (ECF subfamily)
MTMVASGDVGVDLLLIERIAARDAGAIASLYDRHSRVLYSLICRILRDRREAEEILQDVFLVAWTRIDTYDRELGSPMAWLVRIARNRAIDRLRANQVRARAREAASAANATESPETAALVSERRRLLRRALDTLPPEQRQLIATAYFEGLSQSELAQHFELPLGTVKTRIRSGLKTLREALHYAPGIAADGRQHSEP